MTFDMTGISQGTLDDPKAFANSLAKQKAAEHLTPAIVKIKAPGVGGAGEPTSLEVVESDIQQPPPRPTDIEKTPTDGTPKPPTETDDRTAADNNKQASSKLARTNEGDDDQAPRSANPGAGNANEVLGAALGAARAFSGVIGNMESLLMKLPGAIAGKFLSMLPPAFQSFLPGGAILGIVAKAPVSLNSMMNLVGGAALGAVAGQALRSVAGGIPLNGLTGAIGVQTIAKVAGNQVLSSIAGNAAGNIANSLGSTPAAAAMIANTVGIVSNIALNNKNRGIPINSQVLSLAANVALSSAGIRTAIPTNIFGMGGAMMNPVASLLGNTVAASIPMLPGNLSLGNVGALAGIAQNISPAMAQNLLPIGQLSSLLPPNLSAQIPRISPRISAPGSVNDIEQRQRLAPRESSPADTKQRDDVKPEPSKSALVTGTENGKIPYSKMISKYYTLGKLSNSTDVFCHNITPQNGLTVDQIIENLSSLAVNVLDPIVDKIGKPPFITSGFRGPKGSNPSGDHGKGLAVDVSWGNSNSRKHLEIVQEMRKLGIPAYTLAIEQDGGKSWVHMTVKAVHGSNSGSKGDFHLSPSTKKFAGGFRVV
jgi:hypothetical protein